MGTFLTSYIKDPDSTELYGFDFTELLAANAYTQDMITDYQIITPTTVTAIATTLDGAKLRSYIGGGTLGSVHTVTFRLFIRNPSGVGADVCLDRSINLRIQTQ